MSKGKFKREREMKEKFQQMQWLALKGKDSHKDQGQSKVKQKNSGRYGSG